MSEINREKHHRLTKLSVIGGSAILGAFGSAFLSLVILGFMWGWGETASLGVVFGPPIGFLVAGGMAVWYLGKQITIRKVIGRSIIAAFLVTSLLSLLTAILYLLQ